MELTYLTGSLLILGARTGERTVGYLTLELVELTLFSKGQKEEIRIIIWRLPGGYFRMIRGINDCNMESMIYAGMMKV